MFKTRIQIARLFGIPIRIDLSWILIFVWVTWSLAGSYFPRRYPFWPTSLTWGLSALTSLLFFGSVLLHELGHSLVARRFGIAIRDITLFIFGGAASIEEEPAEAGHEFAIAIAGPMVSLGLSGFFAALYLLTRRAVQPLSALSLMLATTNLTLALFNLIPGFPLDGGRVLRALLWRVRDDLTWATRWASRVGQMVAYALVGIGIVQAFSSSWVDGIWLVLIGLFLDAAARSQYQQTSLQQLLEGLTVREVMTLDCSLLMPQLTLDVLVDQYLLSRSRRCYAVGEDDAIQGLITVHNVGAIPRAEWPFTRVADVATPLDKLRTVTPETPLWAALKEMTANGVNQLPVVVGQRLVGMVTREDLITLVHNRSKLSQAN
jgi:Zn-dependent protease